MALMYMRLLLLSVVGRLEPGLIGVGGISEQNTVAKHACRDLSLQGGLDMDEPRWASGV